MMSRVSTFAAVAVLGLSAAACGAPASGGGPQPLTPLSRWQLQVEPQLDRIALAVHDGGLSRNQHAAIQDLVLRYRTEGAPEVVVEAPSGDDPGALQMTWAVSQALQSAGVPAERVRLASYSAPNPRAPVVVGFTRLQAVRPDCSRQWGSLTRHADNGTALGLGCATTANMAAQIADPRDILGQRPIDPADAGRRTLVIERYRAGQRTAAQTGEEDAAVSEAVD